MSLISILLLFSIGYIVYAATWGMTPVNQFQFRTDDGTYLQLSCNISPGAGWNVTEVNLLTDASGTLKVNDTITVIDYSANQEFYANWTLNNTLIGDGSILGWSCNATLQNDTDGNLSKATSPHRQVNIVRVSTASLYNIVHEFIYPEDGFYFLTSTGDSLTLTCNVTPPDPDRNVTEIRLIHDISGAMTINESTPIVDSTNGTEQTATFELNDTADGTTVNWGCNATSINSSDSNSSRTWNANKTSTSGTQKVYVEYPPTVTINTTNNSWSTTTDATLNVTVVLGYTTDTLAYCHLYTNETSWSSKQLEIMVNNTPKIFTAQFESDGTYLYNLRCEEQSNANIYGWASSNYTITIDSVVPTLTTTFVNETWSNVANNSFNYTLTDTNPQDCDLWLNVTGSTLYLNSTATSLTSGIEYIFPPLLFDDGNWTWYISCNDSAGNWVNTSQYQLRVDTNYPAAVSISNSTRSDYCDQWNVSITGADPVNITLDYGTTDAKGSFVYDTDFLPIQNINIPDQSENTYYQFNVTVCDVAGNCNETSDDTYNYPFKLCTGWSVYGIYEMATNFSSIILESGADYVYWWNATNQGWKYATSGGTTNMGEEMIYGDVVWLFEGTNSTWARNITGTGNYLRNLSTGHNYFAITESLTMGDVSATFLNGSDSFGSALQTQLNGSLFNFTDFNAHNNTANTWTMPYYYNWSWNNNSYMTNKSNIEVFWVWSAWNSSTADPVFVWNGTSHLTWYNGSEWQ